MGFWSRFLGIDSFDAAQQVQAVPFEPFISSAGIPVADPGTPLTNWIGGTADAEYVWRTQPNVRKVIGFAARNVASIPLHVHERVSDTNRRRVTDHPLADVTSRPRPRVGPYRFWEAVISDGLLYDRWAVLKRPQDDGSISLSRVPAWRLRFLVDTLGDTDAAWFWTSEEWIELDLDELIFDYGYAPQTAGLSPVDTLRDLLDETTESVQYRRQVWANALRVPQYIHRPEGAPEWGVEQQDRFKTGLRGYMQSGASAGGVPLFEDGMELRDGSNLDRSQMPDLEGRKLSAVEVASAWHIAPELIGAREGNYSNVDAYRQMLYRDSLGPYITAWEQAINVSLTPDLAEGRALYVEANLEAKLRGSFLEQAKVMQSATGAPWMLRNEARAMMNREPVEDGDELVVPLNVLVGGQASPNDSGAQNEGPKSRGVHVKARANETFETQHKQVIARFFKRQGAVVQSALGAKADDWWDAERWDKELSEDLLKLHLNTSTEVARAALKDAGFTEDDYDQGQTVKFLTAVSERVAQQINATTKAQLDEALTPTGKAAKAAGDEDSDDPSEDVSGVFETAETSRADQMATTSVTFASAFGLTESGKQVSPNRATKTWLAGPKPRKSHSAMNGQTVAIDQKFSNGADWPADSQHLSVSEVAGCNCSVQVSY